MFLIKFLIYVIRINSTLFSYSVMASSSANKLISHNILKKQAQKFQKIRGLAAEHLSYSTTSSKNIIIGNSSRYISITTIAFHYILSLKQVIIIKVLSGALK